MQGPGAGAKAATLVVTSRRKLTDRIQPPPLDDRRKRTEGVY